MKLSQSSISALGKIITGDENLSPYRTGHQLVKFFNEYGFDDVYGQGFPSRWEYAEQKLWLLNDSQAIAKIISDQFDPHLWVDFNLEPEEAVAYINKRLELDGFTLKKDNRKFRLLNLEGLHVELAPSFKANETLQHAFESNLEKINKKVLEGDYSGAITNSRSLLETVLYSIEEELTGEIGSRNGSLDQLFTRVRKLMNLDPSRKETPESLKKILTGLINIVNGLANIRNEFSDSHAPAYKADRHHAKLAANSAKTLVDFLLESLSYQKKKGRL